MLLELESEVSIVSNSVTSFLTVVPIPVFTHILPPSKIKPVRFQKHNDPIFLSESNFWLMLSILPESQTNKVGVQTSSFYFNFSQIKPSKNRHSGFH